MQRNRVNIEKSLPKLMYLSSFYSISYRFFLVCCFYLVILKKLSFSLFVSGFNYYII
ncbi:hypothetical protein PEC301879_27800 [Pectobacterium carotovorum subsp. carotovorum]|nr:hypothetical protein PEC301879_27800 [Pectobacterium carotovorum subsp. carotovorum]